jgi:hypothetical protein
VHLLKEIAMCDYSLEAYRTQPAEKGETYVLERFPSGSMGFTAQAGCGTAACIPADSRLRLDGIAEAVRLSFGLQPSEVVTMTRLDGHTYRDAVRFENGRELLLQSLNPGVKATVLAFVSDIAGEQFGTAVSDRELVDV